MSWTATIYMQFPSRAAARTAAQTVGAQFPALGKVPDGDERYALVAPIQPPWTTAPVYDAAGNVTTPGVLATGFWVMFRFNANKVNTASILAQIAASGFQRTPAVPSVVWA